LLHTSRHGGRRGGRTKGCGTPEYPGYSFLWHEEGGLTHPPKWLPILWEYQGLSILVDVGMTNKKGGHQNTFK